MCKTSILEGSGGASTRFQPFWIAFHQLTPMSLSTGPHTITARSSSRHLSAQVRLEMLCNTINLLCALTLVTQKTISILVNCLWLLSWMGTYVVSLYVMSFPRGEWGQLDLVPSHGGEVHNIHGPSIPFISDRQKGLNEDV